MVSNGVQITVWHSSAATWYRRILTAVSVAILLFLISSIVAQSSVSLGGLISEKLLGRSGITDSSLILGSATSSELSVLGFAPVVSTQAVSAMGEKTATLNGRVTSMNGMPIATGYFQWGYSSAAMTNTTPTFNVTTTGDYSSTITGFTQSNAIFYRFVTDADGTAYGSAISFRTPAGTGGFILKTLLRVVVGLAICVVAIVVGARGTGVYFLVSVVIGLISFVVIDAFIVALI